MFADNVAADVVRTAETSSAATPDCEVRLLRSAADHGAMADQPSVVRGTTVYLVTKPSHGGRERAGDQAPFSGERKTKIRLQMDINSNAELIVRTASADNGTRCARPFLERSAGSSQAAFAGVFMSCNSERLMPAASPGRQPVSNTRRSARPTRLVTGGTTARRHSCLISASERVRVSRFSAPRFRNLEHGFAETKSASTAKLNIIEIRA